MKKLDKIHVLSKCKGSETGGVISVDDAIKALTKLSK